MVNILLMKTALIFLFCHFLCARGTHFRGGTLSWKAESASRVGCNFFCAKYNTTMANLNITEYNIQFVVQIEKLKITKKLICVFVFATRIDLVQCLFFQKTKFSARFASEMFGNHTWFTHDIAHLLS